MNTPFVYGREREEYEESLKIYRDNQNTLNYATEKGIEEGMAEGKAEEQRLIAANFKKQGIAIETIALCTGLSAEVIEQLK